MDYSAMIMDGKLAEARAGLTEAVKSSPADTRARTLLFQVLVCLGEWDKALRHLELLVMQSPESATGLLACRNLVSAEKFRQTVHKGEALPDFMAEPPSYFKSFMDMRRCLASGDVAGAAEQLPGIEEAVPHLSGLADGVPFAGITDADSTIFCFLEAFIHDRYLWFPFSAIRELVISEPASFLDLIWAPARIVTWEGLTSECFLPVLYPESFTHDNSMVAIGRMTDWQDLGSSFYRGVGQHLIYLGDTEKGLLELRELTFDFPGHGD